MFAVQTCEGFSPQTYHMWCCTARQCNLHYTEEAVQDLGFSLPFSLEFLTCHELQHRSPKSGGKTSTSSQRSGFILPLLAVLAFCFLAMIGLALLMLWRKRRARRDENITEVKQQIELHFMQGGIPGNEQEELAPVKRPPKMLQMDLLATSDSWKTVSVEGTVSNGAVPRLVSPVTVRLAEEMPLLINHCIMMKALSLYVLFVAGKCSRLHCICDVSRSPVMQA
jgi:hypothetical protein